MELDAEQLEDASEYVLEIRNKVIQLLAETPVPMSLHSGDVGVLAGIDGLVAAAATVAEFSGIAPTQKDKRHLADQLRTGFLKGLKAAREEVVANDRT